MYDERFNSKVERVPESGCWLWTASLISKGYGCLRIKKKTLLAHRLSYEMHNGHIPTGLHVLHRCDVMCCVNPGHLMLETNNDNIADSVAKGRRKGVTRNRPSGLKYRPMSIVAKISKMKIKPERREEIALAYKNNDVSMRTLAKQHNTSLGSIQRIVRGL